MRLWLAPPTADLTILVRLSLTSITFLFLFLKYDTHVSNKFFVLIVKTFLICLEINNVKIHRKNRAKRTGQDQSVIKLKLN